MSRVEEVFCVRKVSKRFRKKVVCTAAERC